jgi:NAD(P)-dependent dehydrogenase (short-subunit alcohol dehydrogenase family)
MKDFSGKVAFITGGASGLGFGLAKVFSEAGCKVVIADIRQDHIDQTLKYFKEKQAEVHAIKLDITDRKAYAQAADEVEIVFGKSPELLFNNAGVNSFGPIEASTFEDWDWLLGVNLNGVINGMQTFVPRMIKAGKGGHIVTTASLGGFFPSPLAAPYSAAKAAIINMMGSYRMGLEKYGIGVSVCCPANIKSNIAESTFTRPEHLKNTGYLVDDFAVNHLRNIYASGMEPVVLAEHMKRGIEENKLYIIPYPESKHGLEMFFKDIVDSVLPVEADPEGVKKREEAMAKWIKDSAGKFGLENPDAKR